MEVTEIGSFKVIGVLNKDSDKKKQKQEECVTIKTFNRN